MVAHCNSTSNVPSMDDSMELYDLSVDPFEQHDLSSEKQEIVDMLKSLTISKDLSCDCYQC